MIKRFSIFCLLLSGIFLLMQAEEVHACTPTAPPPPGSPTATPAPPITLADRVNQADVIVIGTVTGDETQNCPNCTTIYTASVEVESYLKGAGESTIQIQGFGGASLCLAYVREGERYIFLANTLSNGSLRGSYYGGNSPLLAPSDENIATIMTLTQPENVALSMIDNGNHPLMVVIRIIVSVLLSLLSG